MRFSPWLRMAGLAGAAAVAALLAASTTAEAQATISNGLVQLGVSLEGALNGGTGPLSCSGTTTVVGLRYLPTRCEGTADGCLCEGWGLAHDLLFSGSCSLASGCPAGSLTGCTQVSTPSTAKSTCAVDSLTIVHDYHPSVVPELYAVDVTVRNNGILPATFVKYRRAMDWDVEPTPFSEYVTINGVTPIPPAVTYFSNDGFSDPNPVVPAGGTIGSCGPPRTYFTDCGPHDHGAVFDLDLGVIAPGGDARLRIYYGAAKDEAAALSALSAVGAQIWTLGQCDPAMVATCNPATGAPNTFIWAFGELPPIPPATPRMHHGCGTAGWTTTLGAIPPTPVLGSLGEANGPIPPCTAGGLPFYSQAASCLGVPAGVALPGVYCGPVVTGGTATCTLAADGISATFVAGLDVNGDGWVDTFTGDLSSEARGDPGTSVVAFPGSPPPSRILVFPLRWAGALGPGSVVAAIGCS